MFLLDIPEPKNCDDCMFCDHERGFCYLSTTDGTLKTTKSVIEHARNCTKPDWCPASKKFEEVYVITSGEYSAYGINAVTVSKEKAEKLKKYYSHGYYQGDNDAEIETYNINEPHEDLDDIIPIYYVSIDDRGKCFCRRETWMHEKTGKLINDAQSYLASYLGGELVTKRHGLFGDDFLSFRWYGAAKDEEHALKIAQDKRAQMLEKYYMDKGENK